MPLRRLAVRFGHDGYLQERLRAKRGRNRRLLQAELALAPDDRYSWYQLGCDHMIDGAHQEAEAAFARAWSDDGHEAPWWSDLVVRRMTALKRLHRHADAMDLADSQMTHCGELPDFFFAIGDLLVDIAAEQPAHHASLLPMIEAAWRRCIEIGERPDLSNTVVGAGSHLAAHNLALVLELTGRADEAATVRRHHPMPVAAGPVAKSRAA